MDPEPRAISKPSTAAKTLFVVLLLSACYFYQQKTTPTFKPPLAVKAIPMVVVKDTAATPQPPKLKKKKTIYLSFDDGPNKGTQQVVDIVNEAQIPVTLFVVGEHVYGSRLQASVYDSILRSNWIEIANHSYSHALGNKFSKFYTMPDSVVNDFKRCADSLQLTSKIIRTPGRNIWRTETVHSTDIKTSAAAADSLKKAGFDVVGWDLEWYYTNELKAVQTSELLSQQVDSMFINGKTKTPEHLVLLAHDQVFANDKDAASLKAFIAALKNKDEYDFAMIKNYPGLANKNPTDSVVSSINSVILIK